MNHDGEVMVGHVSNTNREMINIEEVIENQPNPINGLVDLTHLREIKGHQITLEDEISQAQIMQSIPDLNVKINSRTLDASKSDSINMDASNMSLRSLRKQCQELCRMHRQGWEILVNYI